MTRLGSESGSITRAKAVLGFALRIAAIARRHIRYVEFSTCRNDWIDGIQPTVNELGLVPGELANCQFSVRGLRGTVSAWKIVDHNAQDVVTRHVGNGRLQSLNVGDCITLICCVSLPLPSHCKSIHGYASSHPNKRSDVGDLQGLLLQGAGHVRRGRLDLGTVEVVGVQSVRAEHIGAGIESNS